MAAFSGFYESPGPPSLSDVCNIAKSHCHGYRNSQQWRFICSLLLLLSFDQNVAKRPCYYHINLIGVISLFVSYWPPPLTMDAVSATIVAGG